MSSAVAGIETKCFANLAQFCLNWRLPGIRVSNEEYVVAVLPIQITSLTDGERAVVLAFISVGLFGASQSIATVGQLAGETARFATLRPFDLWTVLSGVGGACGGLYIVRGWFGLPGFTGIKSAILGAVLVSFLGGLIGGTMILPIYGTMFGPLALFMTLYSSPTLLLLWLTGLGSAHLLIGTFRAERDSIYVIAENDGIPL